MSNQQRTIDEFKERLDFLWALYELLERLRNENEDKTKTQIFNQYSENETKIWRQNILNQFDRVSSSCLRSHFVISLLSDKEHVLVSGNFNGELGD